MDFLKKKMKELLDDDKKPEKKADDSHKGSSHSAPASAPHGERGASDSFYGQATPAGGNPPEQHQYPLQGQGYPPQSHGYPPHGQGYPQQQPYGQAPPIGPPSPYGAPPPMPPGWIQQWDQGSQRWYHVEQATGRTQWDPPVHLPPGPYAPPPAGAPHVAPSGHDERALFGNTQGHGGYDYTPSGAATNAKEKEKEKGHSTAMLAAAGVGGVAAGAWIGHELTEASDDEKRQYAQQPSYVQQPAYAAAPAASYNNTAYPPPVPTHDADGDSISSSDRSSLESKREELIEALEEYQTQDSD